MAIQTKLNSIHIDFNNYCIFVEYKTFDHDTFESGVLRESFAPGQDISTALQDVQSLADMYWTQGIIEDYQKLLRNEND